MNATKNMDKAEKFVKNLFAERFKIEIAHRIAAAIELHLHQFKTECLTHST